jgi:hypothetical protein
MYTDALELELLDQLQTIVECLKNETQLKKDLAAIQERIAEKKQLGRDDLADIQAIATLGKGIFDSRMVGEKASKKAMELFDSPYLVEAIKAAPLTLQIDKFSFTFEYDSSSEFYQTEPVKMYLDEAKD